MFTLYHADCIGQAGNCLYPHKVSIIDTNSLEQAVSRDYVCAEYSGSYRSRSFLPWRFLSQSRRFRRQKRRRGHRGYFWPVTVRYRS